ncbi:helix-turn-helix domain-containing protein [Curtobacterium sp. MCBA15_009]|uniref:helix-turn-helix domain-containing protein n=1 Tax=Curtobacterium sp. MCBA15_009 TaxID=1898737 RepID=UPI0009F71D39|nr:helix-turn-helix domain-containing protein [Curtobacterium sp. MCBA15_009]
MTSSDGSSAHPDPAVRREASGHDVDQATAFYEHLHNARRVSLTASGRPFAYRVRAVGDPSMTLRSSTLTADRWGRIEPEGRYLLTWAQHGTAAIDAGTDHEQVLRPGTAAMYPTGRALTLEAPADTVPHAVDFDATFLRDLDASRRNAEPRPLRFRRHPAPEPLAVLQRRLAAAAPELLDPTLLPLRRRLLTQSIGRLVLDAFAETDEGLFGEYHGNVGRALRFIADRNGDPITSHDVAAAAGLSLRGLQEALNRADLAAPTVLIRQARLRGIRSELQQADPTRVTVAEIALRWGFRHLGRFAGYYLQEFGENPSTTLRT